MKFQLYDATYLTESEDCLQYEMQRLNLTGKMFIGDAIDLQEVPALIQLECSGQDKWGVALINCITN